MNALLELIRTVWRSAFSRGTESSLILVAVALGVSVVTAMLALLLNSAALNTRFERSLEGRSIRVVARLGDPYAFDDRAIFKTDAVELQKIALPERDLSVLREAAPAVEHAFVMDTAYTNRPRLPGLDPSRWSQINFRAVTPEFIPAAGLRLLEGAWLSERDFANRSPVVVVSEAFQKRWFAGRSPLGFKIQGDEASFTVIGVFATPDSTSEFQSGELTGVNAAGLTPLNAGNAEYYAASNELTFTPILGQAANARAQLEAASSARYRNQTRVHSSAERILRQQQLALGTAVMTLIFASGGLLIATMNITNLMLARANHRSRWIAMARAMGATQRRVFGSFLLEAGLLGLLGSVAGAALAVALVAGLNALAGGDAESGFQLSVQPQHLLLGVGIGLFVTTAFASYPALIASRTAPTRALRSM